MKKKKCPGCVWKVTKLTQKQQEVDNLQSQLQEQIDLTKYWKKKAESIMNSLQYDFFEVQNDSCMPKDLQIGYFGTYLQTLIAKYPIVAFILQLFTSISHNRKQRSKSAQKAWHNWSDFYRSYLVDSFLRSRSPKSIFRTNIMLSCFFVLVRIPKSAWDILQRLRIVVSKKVIKRWIQSNRKTIDSSDTTLLYSFDNCDIHLHKTHVRSSNKSSYMHLISHFAVEYPMYADVATADIWNPDPRFGYWLKDNAYNVKVFASRCWKAIASTYSHAALRSSLNRVPNRLFRTDFTIFEPFIGLQTLTNADVIIVIDRFFKDYILNSARTYAFISGDQQVWIKLWRLRMLFPEKYYWLIPVPGEWHWTWHILKAIFKLYGEFIMVPFARKLGFRHIDLSVKNFHYAEDFLEIITFAILGWIRKSMGRFTDIHAWLHAIKPNRTAYELAYACIWYFVPYWMTRASIKVNNTNTEELWRYWLHIFIATNKHNYMRLSIRHLWVLRSMHPAIRSIYDSIRVFSSTGQPGSGIAIDGFNEMINWWIKHMNSSRPTDDRIKWTTAALNHFLPLFRSISNMRQSKTPEDRYKLVKNTEKDAKVLTDWISKTVIQNRTSIYRSKAWNCQLFYIDTTKLKIKPPSDVVEDSWRNVDVKYLENQRMLVETEEQLLESDDEEGDIYFEEDID